MIPIVVGPQGPGFTDIYIDYEHNIVQVTTPPITGINLGKLYCYTGTTGDTGILGYSNNITGPTGNNPITGPTGISLDMVLYNPLDCQFRFIYNNNTYTDSEPLECKQPIYGKTGPTGPTGADVEYVLLYCDGKIKTIYSNGTGILAGICCVCPSLTGWTGETGTITPFGATGCTGGTGINTQFGAIGPTGPTGSPVSIPSLSIIGPQGPPGPFVYTTLADITLTESIQFITNSNDCIKRNYISPNQRTEILFPNTPLNISWITSTTSATFTPLVDGLMVNNDILVRIRMTWSSNNIYFRPFPIINFNGTTFPILISTSFPNLSTESDMICMLHTGDIIQIFPGTNAKYPVSTNQVYNIHFHNISFTITTIYTY